jgi:hypothetical protein
MSRLGNCATLACASLVFAAGMGTAASSGEECGQVYRLCNLSCDGPHQMLVCKSQCDHRLIACDRRPINASTRGDPLPRPAPQGNDRSIADAGNSR